MSYMLNKDLQEVLAGYDDHLRVTVLGRSVGPEVLFIGDAQTLNITLGTCETVYQLLQAETSPAQLE